ncbi:MAG: MerC domain-containing protein [Saprospiraceae bacterium]|nr:MerC domain-containing protein [Saprospiraceae bacterium]
MKKSLTAQVASQADLIGMLAATVCMIHCLVTPLFLVAKPLLLPVEGTHIAHGWGWWEVLDYLFLTVGLIAVVFATHASSPRWLVFGLWISWFCLAVGIHLEEQLVGQFLLYGGSLILIVHHAFHYKYCREHSGNAQTLLK